MKTKLRITLDADIVDKLAELNDEDTFSEYIRKIFRKHIKDNSK